MRGFKRVYSERAIDQAAMAAVERSIHLTNAYRLGRVNEFVYRQALKHAIADVFRLNAKWEKR